MDYPVALGLFIILLLIGSAVIVAFPTNIYAIVSGMVMISIGIITLLVRLHFPPYNREVELRLVEEAEKKIRGPKRKIVKKRGKR